MTKTTYPHEMLASLARQNPFIALMPGMEPLQKTTEHMMQDMADKAEIEDAAAPGQEVVAASFEMMTKAWPGMQSMPNLAAHPMGAMAAGSALSMGIASQMMGTMMGAMAGMMQGAAAAAASQSPVAKPVAKAKVAKVSDAATPAAVTRIAPVNENARPKKKTAPKAAKPASAKSQAPKPAAARSTAPKAVAQAKGPAPATKTARKTAVKANGAAKRATAAKPTAEPVAQSKHATTATSTAIMPEDYRQPAKMKKPAKPDDLKKIGGIGPKLEQVLNTLGIWTYGQIAALKPEEIAWLDDYLQFPGRIGRDDWIVQASALDKVAA